MGSQRTPSYKGRGRLGKVQDIAERAEMKSPAAAVGDVAGLTSSLFNIGKKIKNRM